MCLIAFASGLTNSSDETSTATPLITRDPCDHARQEPGHVRDRSRSRDYDRPVLARGAFHQADHSIQKCLAGVTGYLNFWSRPEENQL